MRTFDFTNGKQFPETLHVRKNVPYGIFNYRYLNGHLSCYNELPYSLGLQWKYALQKAISQMPTQILQRPYFTVFDFVDFVIERVPIYFVNKNQVGAVIEVQETAYYSVYETIVPDNHITVPVILREEMGRDYNNWEECFLSYVKRNLGEERRYPRQHEYPFDHEIVPSLNEADCTMVEIEAEALYRSMNGDSGCKESYPEIFVYMDYFVDEKGAPTRPRDYFTYVIVHELTHAMMDENLWEAFLLTNGQKLSKGVSHSTKRYRLYEEGLATAVGWRMTGCSPDVAAEIMKVGLPYSLGLTPYYSSLQSNNPHPRLHNTILGKRIAEWLLTKMHDPTPYL